MLIFNTFQTVIFCTSFTQKIKHFYYNAPLNLLEHNL